MARILSSLTTRGRCFLSAGVALAVCAVIVREDPLLRIGILLIALPIVTTLIATRTRYLLSCYREVTPARVPTDAPATVKLRLENPGRVPTGLLLLEDHVPYVLGSRPRFVIEQLRPRWSRTITYPVRASVRGRYRVGPLSVRISDPFGFVELSRSFVGRSTLTITPRVHELADARLSGDWSGSGEQRPRAFAAAGTEDVTVREYRQGDDRRRIHWPSTAKAGELMVRREEQPHHSRATILLDNRTRAHRGKGPSSTFEWAVSAVASVGAHLNGGGFTLRLVTADRATTQASWHDRGVSRAAELEFLLDELALIDLTTTADFNRSVDHTPAGLVIAVIGDAEATDIAAINGHRIGAARSLAIVLAVNDQPPVSDRLAASVDLLQNHGWAVAVASPQDKIPDVWGRLTAANRLGASQDRALLPEAVGGPAA